MSAHAFPAPEAAAVRWWDARARVHAGLLAAHAAAVGALSDGPLRWGAWIGAAALAGLALRRPGGGRPGDDPLFLAEPPRFEEGLFAGRGFEWTPEAAQEALERGSAVPRPEGDLVLPESLLAQHVLILGTTGTGKTRLLELLALQAVARGEAVVVIDPKGDEALEARIRRAAGERFRLFSLPHPRRSVRYNPIGRYQDVREVADRIAALLPGSGDALPFRNFGWEIVHTAAREMEGRVPMTLRNLKRAALDRPVGPLGARPRDHYLKTASALIPVLSKLATEALSPEEGGLTWEAADAGGWVVYFSLGSLLGYETASAVAKMALLDLQSYVGARYAYAKGRGTMWLFVDELGDVATPELVNLLNKSRGAGLRVVACGQTAADLEAALGSRARALQALGNANTVFQFRAQSAPDAEVFARMAGERLFRTRSEGAAYEPALLGSGFRTVDDFRARFSESVEWRDRPLVPPAALVELPRFHYFARWEGRVYRGRVPLLA